MFCCELFCAGAGLPLVNATGLKTSLSAAGRELTPVSRRVLRLNLRIYAVAAAEPINFAVQYLFGRKFLRHGSLSILQPNVAIVMVAPDEWLRRWNSSAGI